jgi:hypothetical protein
VFLGYSPLHKGYKCLEPSIGRVYISHDVILDEIVFPLSSLHSNAGAQLKAEILPLHPTLRNIHGRVHVEGPNMPNDANIIDESHADASEDTNSGENVVSTQQMPTLSVPVD